MISQRAKQSAKASETTVQHRQETFQYKVHHLVRKKLQTEAETRRQQAALVASTSLRRLYRRWPWHQQPFWGLLSPPQGAFLPVCFSDCSVVQGEPLLSCFLLSHCVKSEKPLCGKLSIFNCKAVGAGGLWLSGLVCVGWWKKTVVRRAVEV